MFTRLSIISVERLSCLELRLVDKDDSAVQFTASINFVDSIHGGVLFHANKAESPRAASGRILGQIAQRRQKSELRCDTDHTHNIIHTIPCHTIRNPTDQAFIMTVDDKNSRKLKGIQH
jgi:hypothetical protein